MSGSKQFLAGEDFPQMSPSAGKPILPFNPDIAQRFNELLDTFPYYTGRGGKILIVREDEAGITTADADSESLLSIADKTYVHTQSSSSVLWTITHNLGKYPTVRIKDGTGAMMIGDVVDISINEITIEFSLAQTGVAILN